MRGILAFLGGVAFAAVVYAASAPVPPVFKDLGQVYPTPEPTGEPFDKRRLITTLTVQNSTDAETQMMFEAMDVGLDEKKKAKIIASQRYTITADTPSQAGHRDRVLHALRALESALLDYVEVVGPPKERQPMLAPDRYED